MSSSNCLIKSNIHCTITFIEPDADFDSYLFGPTPVPALQSFIGTPTSSTTTILQGGNINPGDAATTAAATITATNTPGQSNDSQSATPINASTEDTATHQTMQTANVIKGLIYFLSQESSQPLWNYEDITAKGKCSGVVCVCHRHKCKLSSALFSPYIMTRRFALISFITSLFRPSHPNSVDHQIGRTTDLLFAPHTQSLYG